MSVFLQFTYMCCFWFVSVWLFSWFQATCHCQQPRVDSSSTIHCLVMMWPMKPSRTCSIPPSRRNEPLSEFAVVLTPYACFLHISQVYRYVLLFPWLNQCTDLAELIITFTVFNRLRECVHVYLVLSVLHMISRKAVAWFSLVTRTCLTCGYHQVWQKGDLIYLTFKILYLKLLLKSIVIVQLAASCVSVGYVLSLDYRWESR